MKSLHLPLSYLLMLTLTHGLDTMAAPVSLNSNLEPLLKEHGLPAVAAAVVKKGEILAAGAVGTRRAGSPSTVTLDDRFHLGSDTKAMTSLIAAMLVEESKLRWDSTVGEIFPELAGRMDPGLRAVTMTQLLSHTSGLPSDNEALDDLLNRSLLREGNLDAPRPLLFHGGSNTKNIAHIWIDLDADFAMVLLTSMGGEEAERALFAEARKLYRRFCPSDPAP